MVDVDRTASGDLHISQVDPGPARACLAIAWSPDQPELVGHTATPFGPALLGRGAPAPDDPAPRLVFRAERPGSSTPGPLLTTVPLSRRQLLLEPAMGGIRVRSIGRHPLLLNGSPVTETTVWPGDVLRVLHSLVLVVLERPHLDVAAPPIAAPPPFPFGAPDEHGLLGESPAAWKLRDALRFAAQSGQHILVQGESGSGKELAARALHALSPRAAGPFIARNAATMPEGLLDAELFGNVRGYPHATSPERPGLIGEAHGGTLFLDELAELPHDLQAHLLRVLDHGGEYTRLGNARPRRSDVRLVAATNRPIDALKHDLAARFPLRVQVPGLNERREDIPLLLRQLFARAVREHAGLAALYGQKNAAQLSAALDPALVEALLRHRYTHHVRELNQLLWAALAGSAPGRVELTRDVRGQLEAARARAWAGGGSGAASAGSASAGAVSAGAVSAAAAAQAAERQAIEAALARAGGKVAPAARLLGLGSRHALYRLMVKHGIRREGEGEPEPDE